MELQEGFKKGTLEAQKGRGAIYFHIAVRGRQFPAVAFYIVFGACKMPDDKTRGQVNYRDPHRFGFGKDGVHKLAAYIAKYCN